MIGKALDNDNDVSIELLEMSQALPDNEDVDLYDEEIAEFKLNGFNGSFRISERSPIPWGSVIGVALLGLGESNAKCLFFLLNQVNNNWAKSRILSFQIFVC